MKKTFTILLLFIGISTFGQKYFTRSGSTHFKASVEAFEPIEAVNKSTSVILKTDTGDIAAQLFMNAFQFKVALMQEHFNENYMDSGKFPKAVFRGKLNGFDFDNLDSEKEYQLSGTLTIRGIKKEINTTAKISFSEEKLTISSIFSVEPKDFDIEIPSIVSKKIANKINITIHYELIEKK